MYRNSFYPLRSIVGPSVTVARILPVTKPPKNFRIVPLPDVNGAPQQTLPEKVLLPVPGQFQPGEIYAKYLPAIQQSSRVYFPITGMATMPLPGASIFGNSFPPMLNFLDTPADFPFPADAPAASLFGFRTAEFEKQTVNIPPVGLVPRASEVFRSNQDREFSFLVLLQEEALVGGICFNGFPYVTSRLESGSGGMTLGNFGLPKEIRLTPLPAVRKADQSSLSARMASQRSQFIDSEFSYVRQEIVSHSGLNYLCIDPVRTNLFLLTLTDFPFIIRRIDLDASVVEASGNVKILTKGFKGFALPWLYFFAYRESARKTARLAGGIIGVASEAVPNGKKTQQGLLALAFPEFEFALNGKKGSKKNYYALYTGHSALGQRRKFAISPFALNYPPAVRKLPFTKRDGVDEMFISDVLQPGQKVILFVQQGEEYERCVAGLKMLMPMIPNDARTERMAERMLELLGGDVVLDDALSGDERRLTEEFLAYVLGLPDEINFCERLRIRIFELDPVDGVSPAAVGLTSKYATLLADTAVEDFSEIFFDFFLKGIPFRQPPPRNISRSNSPMRAIRKVRW